MLYFTSDLHFYHKNIITYCDRPYKDQFEMNEDIVKIWNKTVSDEDDIFILGDLGFCSKTRLRNTIGRLNGTKHLILGNHDNPDAIPEDLFELVSSYEEITYNHKKIVLFHYPIESWNGAFRGALHFHGHIHSNDKALHVVRKDEIFENEKRQNVFGARLDVGWDSWGKPVEFGEILKYINDNQGKAKNASQTKKHSSIQRK